MVLGTRPEIIKMSPVVRALAKAGAPFFVLHTGQHYTFEMDRVFFENLGLGEPAYNLHVGSGSHAEETAKMLLGITDVLVKRKVTGILVEGDTNTVLAGALAASKLGVRVGHVEAGLRSGDRTMPEELNRIVTDHLSDVLFAPTPSARENLRREAVPDSKIVVTGNTVVDAVMQNIKLAARVDVGELTGGGEYMLATLHRQENVDSTRRLRRLLRGLQMAAEATGLPVVWPAHPRAKKAVSRQGLRVDPRLVRVIPPVDYLHFLRLEKEASLVLTDSGGVQEEACILEVPCVTLRDNTERPETIEVGANELAGAEPGSIASGAKRMITKHGGWKNPFGDGRAAERIVRAWCHAP